MKRLSNLQVGITYNLEINADVSDEVYNGIQKIIDRGYAIWSTRANLLNDKEVVAAYEWLLENTPMKDSEEVEFEVEFLEV